MEWLNHLIDWALQTFGMLGIWAIIFAESGLFFGFFLPGDSLLIASGIFAAAGRFNVWILVIGIVIAAIAGDQVGYWTGKKFGSKIFKKEGKYLNQDHLASAKQFFDKYGPIAIILARFTPAVRTFTPIVAGAANMNYSLFVRYNILGGVLWGAGLTLLAYYLGTAIGEENMKQWEWYIIISVAIITAVPVVREIYHHRKKKQMQNHE